MKTICFNSKDTYLVVQASHIVAIFERDSIRNTYSTVLYLSNGLVFNILSKNECLACEIDSQIEKPTDFDEVLEVESIFSVTNDSL